MDGYLYGILFTVLYYSQPDVKLEYIQREAASPSSLALKLLAVFLSFTGYSISILKFPFLPSLVFVREKT